LKQRAVLFLKGVAMGAADIIPGVSGGTIALITGIYEELIESIRRIDLSLFKILFKDGVKKFWSKLNGNFLLTIYLGITAAVFSLANIISFLLANHEYKIWGLFFGLVLSSAVMIIKQVETLNSRNVLLLVSGIVIAGLISFLSPASTPNTSIFIFLSGSIAVTATILPGISGSFILLLLSKYEFIINAIKNFDLQILSIFAVGCIVGLIIFSRVLSYLFTNFKNEILSLLSGFLIGSLIKIWPFRNILESRINSEGEIEAVVTRPEFPNLDNLDQILFFIAFSIVGYVLISFLQKKSLKDNKE